MGRKAFIAQRKLDSWLDDIQTSLENRVEEAERGREEDRLLYLERQKKMIVRILADKYGADAKLPENWAEGLSSDDLDKLTDKIFESASMQDVLALFR
ncbi:MAG: hypothetical protein IJM54_07945 [Thermoguttaceae bacterium]|nr:hypothetical protein [Thermoguttaceae bacterium]